MCGIFGHISNDKRLKIEKLNLGLVALQHRGPDFSDYIFCDKNGNYAKESEGGLKGDSTNLFLGQTRLSIIDLSKKGNQPMYRKVKDRGYWIVFNGEIYNYLEIKKELVELGYIFYSNSDTEVLLLSYVHWGKECLNKFNGMFSFAVWNESDKVMFLARDRMGKKPLFYIFNENGDLSFSSEIKSFVASGLANLRMRNDFIFGYLVFDWHYYSPAMSCYENINQLRGGHCLTWKDGIVNEEKWWNDEGDFCFNAEVDDLEKTIFDLLKDSVRLRLRSDVPVGMCLSGGIDSSSILYLIDNIFKESNLSSDINVFTAIQSGSKNNEKDNVLKTIDFISSKRIKNHWIEIKDINFNDIFDFCYSHDEPVRNLSVLNQYLVMKKINENGIKVILNGQGADELFWGYPRYFLQFARINFNNLNLFSSFLFLWYYKKRKGLTLENLTIDFVNQLFPTSKIMRMGAKSDSWINFSQSDIDNIISRQKIMFPNSLKDFQKSELFYWHLPSLLRDEDRNSMRFGIESRLPYLDYRLVKLALSLPFDLYNFNRGQTKSITRKIFQNYLPSEVVWQVNKVGFYEKIFNQVPNFKEEALCFIKNSNSLKEYVDIENATKINNLSFIWKLFNLAVLLDENLYKNYFNQI